MSFKGQSHTPLSNVTAQTSVPSTSQITLANSVPQNLTTVSLQPGVYLASALVTFALTGTTTAPGVYVIGISDVSATFVAQPGDSIVGPDPTFTDVVNFTTVSTPLSVTISEVVLTILVPTSIYLVVNAQFSAGTVKAYGTFRVIQTNNP